MERILTGNHLRKYHTPRECTELASVISSSVNSSGDIVSHVPRGVSGRALYIHQTYSKPIVLLINKYVIDPYINSWPYSRHQTLLLLRG